MTPAPNLTGTDLLHAIAAMPEAARMSLIVDVIQCPRGSPVAWSDFAIDALAPVDRAIDENWMRINAVIGGCDE
jgi:hypothetical protein